MPSVYALGDPRTDEIRYIGIAQDVYKRYAQHLNSPHYNGEKNSWMEEIKELGMLPTLITLEDDVDKGIIFDRENYWIQHYLAQGAPLVNVTLPPKPKGQSIKEVDPQPFRKTTHPEIQVKEIAQRKGFSLSSLSRFSDVDIKTLRRIYHNPATSTTTIVLNRLADALDVDVSELIRSVPNE
jgi:lambda repressor-like predicted transcriptional regulator